MYRHTRTSAYWRLCCLRNLPIGRFRVFVQNNSMIWLVCSCVCLSFQCRSKSANLNDNQKTTYCDWNCYLYRRIVGVHFIKRWRWHQCHTGGSEILLTLPASLGLWCLIEIRQSYASSVSFLQWVHLMGGCVCECLCEQENLSQFIQRFLCAISEADLLVYIFFADNMAIRRAPHSKLPQNSFEYFKI